MGDGRILLIKGCDRKVMLFMTVSPFALALWAVEVPPHCLNRELLYQYPCDIVTNLEVCRYC